MWEALKAASLDQRPCFDEDRYFPKDEPVGRAVSSQFGYGGGVGETWATARRIKVVVALELWGASGCVE